MLRAMRRFLVLLAVAACSEKRPPPAAAAPSAQPAPAPAAADPAVDEGIVRITARGKPAGEEKFRIVTEGPRREIATTTKLRRDDAEVTVEATLVTDEK